VGRSRRPGIKLPLKSQRSWLYERSWVRERRKAGQRLKKVSGKRNMANIKDSEVDRVPSQ
jgi:hypothetical protein